MFCLGSGLDRSVPTKEPRWVVVTATSFVGGMWFKPSAPAVILLQGAMGMIWFGVAKAVLPEPRAITTLPATLIGGTARVWAETQ